MFTSSFVALSLSAVVARAVKVLSRRGVATVSAVYSVPLPIGCIDEGTGRVEDARSLVNALRGIPIFSGEERSPRLVHLVVPRQLSFTSTLTVPAASCRLSTEAFIRQYRAALPGDPSSLIVDLHRDETTVLGERRVMLVAAKREAIGGYVRVLGELRHEIASITSGEIARYNLICAVNHEVLKRGVFVAAVEPERGEIALWDRGLLAVSDELRSDDSQSSGSFRSGDLNRLDGLAARGERIANQLRLAVGRGLALGLGGDLLIVAGASKTILPPGFGTTTGQLYKGFECAGFNPGSIFGFSAASGLGARIVGGEFDDPLGALVPFTRPVGVSMRGWQGDSYQSRS